MTDELKQEAEEYAKNHRYYEVEKRDGLDCAKEVTSVTIEQAYLAGAEPREKRIAELTDKIKTLEKALEGYKKIAKWCDNCEQKKELEKENAELKEKYKLLGDIALIAKNVELENNITKAKEIIKKLISAYTSYADSFDDRDKEIVEEAEQFLKDSEVEK